VPGHDDVGFVCADPVLRRRMQGLAAATRARMPVHIHGETGTGKELMARHVHAVSGRSGDFVPVNCGAIPESLFIRDLFGHERGAYTNARQDGAPGLLRAADGGTLLLDEVADRPGPLLPAGAVHGCAAAALGAYRFSGRGPAFRRGAGAGHADHRCGVERLAGRPSPAACANCGPCCSAR
jgi:hypothetical protein